MKHILYDMDKFLLKKIIFCRVNIKFRQGRVEVGYNGGKNLLIFFMFHTIKNSLGGLLFFQKNCGKLIFKTDGGYPPSPWKIPPK